MHCRRSPPRRASDATANSVTIGDVAQQTITSRETDAAWSAVLDAARVMPTRWRVRAGRRRSRPAPPAAWRSSSPAIPARVVAWRPHAGFEVALPADDPRRALIDLYLPICSATDADPITVGHLGQSLDGFIATHSGDSQFVTGEENILHLHRMRALCDAVIVGAGTVAADDPQLTTRHVEGREPAARRAGSDAAAGRALQGVQRRLGRHAVRVREVG